MPAEQRDLGLGDLAGYTRRVALVVTAQSPPRAEARKLRGELTRRAKRVGGGSYERGAIDSLVAVLEAVSSLSESGRLPAPSVPFEPGSLPERLLLAIADGVQGANNDLADRLGTDVWQVSRAGRRLRELGLADRLRVGRLNTWTLTPAGERESIRVRAVRA